MSADKDLNEPLAFTRVKGLRLAAAAAGIRYQNRDDLVLLALPEGSTAAAVFTKNVFCAAPVTLARQHLAARPPRYLLINSGNANAGTGGPGLVAARSSCELLARIADCQADEVLPFSTGVIGEPLPLSPIENALPGLLAGLDEGAWPQAARAIMTTDTKPKLVSRQLMLQGTEVNVTGIAKGAGMICPNMATMLAFIATDVALPQALLQEALEAAVAPSFNSISVDGDTSTNDACVLMATGQSGLGISDLQTLEGRAFSQALLEVCMHLARAIILDAEGATKLLDIEVSGARTPAEAKEVAYTLAHSPLVKTAMFASDPNWGRILAAVGRAPVAGLEAERVSIHLGEVPIVTAGARDPNYQEAMGQAVVAKAEIPIRVHLGMGEASARVLSCDLSFDYVKINAEYRS